jgi:hypothetical protein
VTIDQTTHLIWDFGIDMKFFKAGIDNKLPILPFASETIFALSGVISYLMLV